MHIHHSICIGLVTQGKRVIQLSHSEETIHDGDLFVINVRQPHAILPECHSYVAVTLTSASGSGNFATKIQSDHSRKLFITLLDSIKGNSDKVQDDSEVLLNSLSDYKSDTHVCTCQKKPILQALSFIEQHFQEPLTIEEMASRLCISPFHFCHLFKCQVGMSPHSYLLQYRIKQSRILLRNHHSILDTALTTGFYDSSHFIRHFISYEGVSPKYFQTAYT